MVSKGEIIKELAEMIIIFKAEDAVQDRIQTEIKWYYWIIEHRN